MYQRKQKIVTTTAVSTLRIKLYTSYTYMHQHNCFTTSISRVHDVLHGKRKSANTKKTFQIADNRK